MTEDPGVEVVRLEAGVVDEAARQEVEMRRVEFKLRGEGNRSRTCRRGRAYRWARVPF